MEHPQKPLQDPSHISTIELAEEPFQEPLQQLLSVTITNMMLIPSVKPLQRPVLDVSMSKPSQE